MGDDPLQRVTPFEHGFVDLIFYCYRARWVNVVRWGDNIIVARSIYVERYIRNETKRRRKIHNDTFEWSIMSISPYPMLYTVSRCYFYLVCLYNVSFKNLSLPSFSKSEARGLSIRRLTVGAQEQIGLAHLSLESECCTIASLLPLKVRLWQVVSRRVVTWPESLFYFNFNLMLQYHKNLKGGW